MEFPKTHWIWIPGLEEKVMDEPKIVFFRKAFSVREPGRERRIRISADTRYKLYVNGSFVQFGPARGDRQVWYYDEIDIAPFLRKGENVIAVEVLRYATGFATGNYGMARTATPGLFVEDLGCAGNSGSGSPAEDGHPAPWQSDTGDSGNGSLIEDGHPAPWQSDTGDSGNGSLIEDGRSASRQSDTRNRLSGSLTADGSWKCRKRQNYRICKEAERFAPLMYLEECGADAETKGWKLPGYDDSGWSAAAAYSVIELKAAACPADLQERPIPFMKLAQRAFRGVVPGYDAQTAAHWEEFLAGRATVEIPARTRMEIELNAGELSCGYLSLRMRQGAGTTIRILTSEGYVQRETSVNGIGPLKKDRLDRENGYLHGYTDTYHVGGYGEAGCEEVYEPYWFRTFRFVRLEIETAEQPCVLTGFDYLETGYPLEVKAQVQTSDESMRGIWDISLRSLKLCMHETYIDCPFYEQLQYAMDSRSEILYTYMVSADDRLARQCMDAFRRSQREDGMINSCYPNDGPNVIPGFSIYYILMVYDHMMYFGDKKLVWKHLPCIDGILRYFDEHLEERGLVGKTGGHISERYWSFIDWSPPWGESVGMPPAGYRGPLTMESLLYIMGLQHAAKLCEYVGRMSTAREYAERARAVQAAVNRYCRDEEGVYTDGPGVPEYSQHCQMFAVLTDTVPIQEGRVLLARSMEERETFAQHTVATAFYLFRALEKAGMYAQTGQLWDLWRGMLEKHLTTCVENETDERSDCHGWGALALYELPAVTLGVQPAAPGFEKIRIAPSAGVFTSAKGCAATRWGEVSVEWEKQQDGSLKLAWKVPEGMEDRVVLGPE